MGERLRTVGALQAPGTMELTGDSLVVPARPLLFPRAFLCQKYSVSICSAAINQWDAHTSTGQPCVPWDQGAARCLRQCSAPECGSFISCLPTAWWGSRWQFSELLGLSGSFRTRAEQPGTLLHPCVVPEGLRDCLRSDMDATALVVDEVVPCPCPMPGCPCSSCSNPGKEPGRSSENPCPL